MIATGATIIVATMHPFAVLALGCGIGLLIGVLAGFVLAETFEARAHG